MSNANPPEMTTLGAPGEYIDPPKWHARYGPGCRLLLDGRDITGVCRGFHSGEGWAECYVRDSNGRPLFRRANGGTEYELATDIYRGRFEVVPAAPPASDSARPDGAPPAPRPVVRAISLPNVV